MTSIHDNALARFSLEGQIAWVTGGGGLLGAEVSRALAEHGAHVVVSSRDATRVDATVAGLVADGFSVEGLTVDVANENSVDAAMNAIAARHGQIDSCVNLASYSTGKTFLELTAEDWEAGMLVTSTGAFLIGRAAGRLMRDGGSIVQFGSMYGVVSPDPRNYPDAMPINPPDYGFAKAGILQLVRYQAIQLASTGIRVNAVVPGPFPGAAARENEEFISRLESRVPLGRVGVPQEIVGAVVFLCSPAARFVTGTSVVVDGGWTAW